MNLSATVEEWGAELSRVSGLTNHKSATAQSYFHEAGIKTDPLLVQKYSLLKQNA